MNKTYYIRVFEVTSSGEPVEKRIDSPYYYILDNLVKRTIELKNDGIYDAIVVTPRGEPLKAISFVNEKARQIHRYEFDIGIPMEELEQSMRMFRDREMIEEQQRRARQRKMEMLMLIK